MNKLDLILVFDLLTEHYKLTFAQRGDMTEARIIQNAGFEPAQVPEALKFQAWARGRGNAEYNPATVKTLIAGA